ncbi:hypothetical protein AB1A81_13365 [Bdellovibrio bacteriovorus]|uniref:Uncharacterized protein n=1 Tax=Bdellovibrio bacteriovorus (strain ATCC 15356 / DSM 50701 / NCIMB 9529 / HD100) TaxID=264462 RepID=Q6MJ73_BDEBA|nr:hypothetical protein [Bdellovibrio bacteriovorus]AHZ85393.1 hypothetical protein EP01_10645 [Bdellovibrio bacteriovorus]BEV69287.1 hypothetical protein Bb109J_c2707 [Bdellovibrio bacteriovorus]CAE80688.1 hypothetical protein predicted by Glimmer/Critica [Bdellovibrio bacteriovorus HD100]
MAKRTSIKKPVSETQQEINQFVKDLQILGEQPVSRKHTKVLLEDYPFDGAMLNASSVYRKSRELYLSLGGAFTARVCSTMRSLSAQDLFKDNIEFTPTAAELVWFRDFHHEVADPLDEIRSLMRFNEISLFHEQNHRVIWRLLPPAPTEQRDISRYLNFAESLVVTLDLALGDQLGKKLSPAYERMKVIYRSGGEDAWMNKSKAEYRQYLLALCVSTYYLLEMINPEDILKAVDYVLPGQKKMNKDAVRRGLELSELFTRVTNPLWQERYWQMASAKLQNMHADSEEDALYLPEDPLDMEESEFFFVRRVFDYYGL